MSKFAHRLAYDPMDLFYECEVLGREIKTQEELESKGYKFTFGFQKGEDKLKKSKVLENKDSNSSCVSI